MKYIISTDSTADLSYEYLNLNEVYYLALNYTVNEKIYTYKDDYNNLFEDMRAGAKVSTMQANIAETRAFFEEFAKKGISIIHLSLSSALSGSFSTETLVANDVMEDYPDIKICVIDSLCASGGQGLLVRKAVEKRNEGSSMDDVIKHIEEIRPKIAHSFTVEDMIYLYRGGRVSKGKTIIANAINIKPILNCNEDGKLIPISKVRGRKKSLKAIVELMEENLSENYIKENPYVLVYHADCLDDAKIVSQELNKAYGFTNIEFGNVGPTIGAHSGPGTIAVFYIGKHR